MMRLLRRILLASPLLFFLSYFMAAPQPTAKFVPPEGQVLLVVGQDIDNINSYLKAVGPTPAGFAVYTSVEFADGLMDRVDHGGGVQHAQKLIDRHDNTVIQVGLYMVHSLEKVYSGDLDESLDALGNWIRQTNRPVFLRIGYEFDLPENDYDPDDYKLAFRYVVDYLRKMEVKNVATVWHSYAAYVKQSHWDWYPGDDYVDWFGLSYFRQPMRYIEAFAKLAGEKGKPLMIAEASPWHVPTTIGPNSWKKWFVPLFQFIEDYDVKMLCYINCNWDEIPLFKGRKWGDARVQEHDYVQNRWKRKISEEKFLKSSPDLFKKLSFTP